MVDREFVKELNIFQRMDFITDSLAVVQKNLEVGYGKSKYKAVSERDVIDAVKPLEHEFGVYSYPVKREVLESHILESDEVYVDNNAQTEQRKTKTTFMSRIKTVYRFVNVDKPEEYVDQESFAEGIDTQDKGSGKAMTYSDKYALMKAYKISTGDDPDQNASEDRHYKQYGSQTPFRVVQNNIQNMVAILNQNGMTIPEIAAALGQSEEDFRAGFVNEAAAREIEKALGLLLDKAK